MLRKLSRSHALRGNADRMLRVRLRSAEMKFQHLKFQHLLKFAPLVTAAQTVGSTAGPLRNLFCCPPYEI
jgi:hypothetical protein